MSSKVKSSKESKGWVRSFGEPTGLKERRHSSSSRGGQKEKLKLDEEFERKKKGANKERKVKKVTESWRER